MAFWHLVALSTVEPVEELTAAYFVTKTNSGGKAMGRKFKSSDVLSTQTIFGVGGIELDMVARLNQMIANQNLGHTGSFRGGLGRHSNQPMPAQQNFQSPAVLRSLGNTVNHRAGMNQGLPNTQPPVGFPNPMLALLLPVSR